MFSPLSKQYLLRVFPFKEGAIYEYRKGKNKIQNCCKVIKKWRSGLLFN